MSRVAAIRRRVGGIARSLGMAPILDQVRRIRRARRHRSHETKRIRSSSFDGVTVIIPTYRPNRLLSHAVRSALRQTLPRRMLDVIISVNGSDEAFFRRLRRRYALNRRVRVVYTPVPGLSAGRNYALRFVQHDLLTYLDDDDYFTRGYLRSMFLEMSPAVELVCGRVEDELDGVRDSSTYLTRALRLMPRLRRTKDYARVASLLTTAWGKIYRTEFVRDRYIPFDESVSHTEDVLFWAENIHNLTLPLAAVPADGREALVRRLTAGSMSRPDDDRARDFWVRGRLDVIERLERVLFHPERTLLQKRFVLVKIDAQVRHVVNFVRGLDGKALEDAREEIAARDLQFANFGDIAPARGIAFCHNFAPYKDASAYVAAKRLPELSAHAGKAIRWTVVSAHMSNLRGKDSTFDEFFAKRRYSSITRVDGSAYFNPRSQHQWAEQAVEATQHSDVDYIYSRSMFAGSHEAAYRYKEMHPDVTWYAEFSDPIFLDTTGGERPPGQAFEGDEEWLNEYWRTVEDWAFSSADAIIFTNTSQREVMTERLDEAMRARVVSQSEVMSHPILDSRWANVVRDPYSLDPSFINVAYFGSFYPDRTADRLLELLNHPRVRLHLFVPAPEAVETPPTDRLRINPAVDHLNFLNIGSKMDYLVLNDLSYSGPVNPYVPSKLADYLATGSKVIAFVQSGTILSQFDDPQMVKVREGERAILGEGGFDYAAALLPTLKEAFASDMSIVDSARRLQNGRLSTGFKGLPEPPFNVADVSADVWRTTSVGHGNTFSLYLLGLRPVYLLSRAAILQGREGPMDLADKLVRSFQHYAQRGLATDMMDNDHAIAERIENLTYYAYAAAAFGRDSVSLRRDLRSMIERDVSVLLDGGVYQRNHNHGIIADRAVLLGAILLGAGEHHDWIERAVARLKEQVAAAYGDDGVHVENSFDYHRTITTLLASCSEILRLVGDPYAATLNSTIASAGEYFAFALKPNGKAPLFGDTKGDDASPSARFLDLLPNPSPEIRYMLTQGAEGHPPARLFHRFSSGYVFMRETVEPSRFAKSIWVSLRAGYSTRTHKQRDDLSLGLFSNGYDIFVDSGMSGYLHSDPMTQHMASVGAHTTTSVDDIEYSLARANGRRFRIVAAQQAREWDYVAASNHVHRGVCVYRHLYYLRKRNALVIHDHMRADSTRAFRQHFKLGPDIVPTEFSSMSASLGVDGAGVQATLFQLIAAEQVEKTFGDDGKPWSFLSTGFGSTTPTHTLTYTRRGQEVEFVTVVRLGDGMDVATPVMDGRTVRVDDIQLTLTTIEPPRFYGARVTWASDSLRVQHQRGLGATEFAVYLISEETGQIVLRTDYSDAPDHVLPLSSTGTFTIMYYVRNAYSESAQGILGSVMRTPDGAVSIVTREELHVPRVRGAECVQVGGAEYEFQVDVDYDYPLTVRWWVYRDGANVVHLPEGELCQRFTLDRPGHYVVMWSLNDSRFGEFSFEQFPVIVIEG